MVVIIPNSNTTFVKVKYVSDELEPALLRIQIQHLLKLNQEQVVNLTQLLNSNTTFVKVKYSTATKSSFSNNCKFKYNIC